MFSSLALATFTNDCDVSFPFVDTCAEYISKDLIPVADSRDLGEKYLTLTFPMETNQAREVSSRRRV